MQEKPPQLTAAEQQELQKYLAETKKVLKQYGKNELIRIIGALLVDNASLKGALMATQSPVGAQQAPVGAQSVGQTEASYAK